MQKTYKKFLLFFCITYIDCIYPVFYCPIYYGNRAFHSVNLRQLQMHTGLELQTM